MEKLVNTLFYLGLALTVLKGAELLVPKRVQANIGKAVAILQGLLTNQRKMDLSASTLARYIAAMLFLVSAIELIILWMLTDRMGGYFAALSTRGFAYSVAAFIVIYPFVIGVLLSDMFPEFAKARSRPDEDVRWRSTSLKLFGFAVLYSLAHLLLTFTYWPEHASTWQWLTDLLPFCRDTCTVVAEFLLEMLVISAIGTLASTLVFGALATIFILGRWLLCRISEYDKGPFAALVLLATIALGIVSEFLR